MIIGNHLAIVRNTLLFVYKYEFTKIENIFADHKRFKKSPPPCCEINLLYGSLLSCFYKIITIPMDTTPPPQPGSQPYLVKRSCFPRTLFTHQRIPQDPEVSITSRWSVVMLTDFTIIVTSLYRLWGNEVGDDGVEPLAESLSTNNTLEDLE